MRYAIAIATAEDRHAIDPFGAAPHEASRIAGFGGPDPAAEPGYVFRTVPVEVPVGVAAFRVALADLSASEGTISVELSVIPDQPDAVPLRVTTVVRLLRQLIEEGGAVLIRFEAHRAHRYAVAGYSHGSSLIAASALTVDLISGAEAAAFDAEALERDTTSADRAIEAVPIPRLRALDMPDFGDPLSQPMTAGQRRHAAFARWRTALHLDDAAVRDDVWAQAFVLQAFSRFGALVAGARAIGFGVADQAVPAWLARFGCTVLCVEHAEPERPFDRDAVLARLRRPAVCPPDRFAAAVDCVGLDLRFPEMVRGDPNIAWVDGRRLVTRFEDAFWMGLYRLSPGGLCVHVFDFDPVGAGIGQVPGRARVERLALNAISFGHDVVQLCFRTPAEDRRAPQRTVPFGLIARRT